jgi:quinol monooxygenase YgiN
MAIKPYKTDEFDTTMRSFSRKILKEKGCLGYSVYRDTEKENTYSVVGEWKTRQAMEKHFRAHDFKNLIGATRAFEAIQPSLYYVFRDMVDFGVYQPRKPGTSDYYRCVEAQCCSKNYIFKGNL